MKDKAVIFDMDGVLMDNNPWHISAWIEFAERHERKITPEEVESAFGNTNRDYLTRLFGRPVSGVEAEIYSEEKETIYRETIRPVMKPLAGLKEFLEDLAKEGFKIGLATGGPLSNVNFILDTFGIAGYFEEIVHDKLVEHGKPDPEGYLLASRLLKIEPASCVVFEDSANGVLAAKRAGMHVIGVNTSGKPTRLEMAELIIDDFSQITVEKIIHILKQSQ